MSYPSFSFRGDLVADKATGITRQSLDIVFCLFSRLVG
jgi:hypothetical protein